VSLGSPVLILAWLQLVKTKLLPDQLRIGKNTPSERDPQARLDFQKKRSARVIR